jgi:hypothetical protein
MLRVLHIEDDEWFAKKVADALAAAGLGTNGGSDGSVGAGGVNYSSAGSNGANGTTGSAGGYIYV